MKAPRINGKHRLTRGSLLLEVTAGFGLLLAVSLMLLKAAVTVTTVQKWTITQSLSDAYMSREVALGKRYPFDGVDGFLGAASPWPEFPAVSVGTVEIGRMPGGTPIWGELHRTRVPDSNNLPAVGATVLELSLNPTNTQAYQLQSYIAYQVSGRDYVKSRTVFRAR